MTEFRRFDYTNAKNAELTAQMVDIYCHAFRLIPYVAAYCVSSPSMASGAVLKDVAKEAVGVDPEHQSISAGAIYMSALEHMDDATYHDAIRRIADMESKSYDGVPMPFEKPRDQILRILDRTIVEEAKMWQELQIIDSKIMIEDAHPEKSLDDDIREYVTIHWPSIPYFHGRLPRQYLVPQMWRVANSYFHGIGSITRKELNQITSVLSEYTH